MKIEIDDGVVMLAAELIVGHDDENAKVPDPMPAKLKARVGDLLSHALSTMSMNDDFYNAFDEWIAGE